MKNVSKKANEFNEFRFGGLDIKNVSNKFFTMKRFSKEEDKIVVKIAEQHLIPTKFGYALILDNETVVFLKDWQISNNYYGIECLLTKEYFIPKKWGEWSKFSKIEENYKFEHWLNIAKAQENMQEKDEDGDLIYTNKVKWEK